MVNKLHTQTHRDPLTHKKHQHTSQYVHVSSGSPAPSLNPVPLLHLVRDPRRHRLVALKMAKDSLAHASCNFRICFFFHFSAILAARMLLKLISTLIFNEKKYIYNDDNNLSLIQQMVKLTLY